MRAPAQPTMADVAMAAGVGTGTVSRVLNEGPNVRESTRRRVLEVIERLGYRPSHLAAALSRGTSRTVAILVPHLTRPSAVARLAGALGVLDEQGYDTIVCNVDTPEQRDHHLSALAVRHRADGVIIVSIRLAKERIAAFRRGSIPVVTVDAVAPGVPQTIIDDVAGGQLATAHLLSLGHRRIGFVGDLAGQGMEQDLGFTSSRSRLQGYRRELAAAGIGFDPELVRLGRHSAAAAADLAGQLIRRPIRPPPSSPPPTPRRWACSAPRSSGASRYRAGCRWWASMTPSPPRCSTSAPCTSRSSTAAPRAPGGCARCCAGPRSGRCASCCRCAWCSGAARPGRRRPGQAAAGRICFRQAQAAAGTNAADTARARGGGQPTCCFPCPSRAARRELFSGRSPRIHGPDLSRAGRSIPGIPVSPPLRPGMPCPA